MINQKKLHQMKSFAPLLEHLDPEVVLDLTQDIEQYREVLAKTQKANKDEFGFDNNVEIGCLVSACLNY